MLREEVMTSEQLFFFVKELFATIREINRRLDELMWVQSLLESTPHLQAAVKDRQASLQNTKDCLICSIYEVRTQFIKIFGQNRYNEIFGINELRKELERL